MKPFRFNIIIALLIACNVNLYAQSGLSDFLSGFVKGFTDKTENNNKSQQGNSNSSSSNSSTSQSSISPFSINKKVTSSRTETLNDGSTGITTMYEDGSNLYINKGVCSACSGNKICRICGGRGTTLYKCLGCGNTGICGFCAGTGLRHTELYTDSDGNGWLRDLVTGKTQTIYANSGSSGGGNYNSNSSSSSTGNISSSTNDNGKATCKYCRGTGNCSKCKGKGWHDNTLNAEPIQCPSCHGNGKCFMCSGRGYYYY